MNNSHPVSSGETTPLTNCHVIYAEPAYAVAIYASDTHAGFSIFEVAEGHAFPDELVINTLDDDTDFESWEAMVAALESIGFRRSEAPEPERIGKLIMAVLAFLDFIGGQLDQ